MNSANFLEHEVKFRLNRFLFLKKYWDNPCEIQWLREDEADTLLFHDRNRAPDRIILNEPTNNDSIVAKKPLIAISHDMSFLDQVNFERDLDLSFCN